ncbi:TPA: 2-C-methyl-D-erythritol 4-phosphate cytidylyltransferase [Candidatus Sumerlaeota bacterium]|jgi:2-C-methyl-D-erythritol 4-phosphate cytidylyltransferase / 2-C-methyl-D-erythritol 2,4-cyclodiphosphate synthase|nr:2-C-methyl-D-erythritol 4-phosphate cytidylyltransferase [Candidatus Sumerlaeota bacterium]
MLPSKPLSLAVIIAAAGSGKRLPGSVPKQWRLLGGIPLLAHSFRFFDAFPGVQQFAIALDAQTLAMSERTGFLVSAHGVNVRLVEGGGERQESVWKALETLDPAPDIVLIHDAARPFPPVDGVQLAIEMAVREGGAILARPVTETIKRVNGNGLIIETLDRSVLRAAQTPQVFQYGALMRAYEKFVGQLAQFTDDAVIFEAAGGKVLVVNGSENNFKVTHPEDFERAENLLK